MQMPCQTAMLEDCGTASLFHDHDPGSAFLA
jgi:hypothetical protein